MYSVRYLYFTGIRCKKTSLKNTELYLPVRPVRWRELVALHKFVIRGSHNKVKSIARFSKKYKVTPHPYNSARDSET